MRRMDFEPIFTVLVFLTVLGVVVLSYLVR